MATEEEDDNKRSTQNGSSFEVITLSSDEEDNKESSENLEYLFDRFILACRQHIAKETLTTARQVFKAAPKDLICSKEITDMLKRNTKLVNQENASGFMDDMCERLTNGKLVKESTLTDKNNLHGRSTCSVSDVTSARDFKEIRSEATGNGVEDVADISDDDVDFVCEIQTERTADIPSTSSAHHNDEVKFPKSGKMTTKDLSTKQKKRLGMKLKRRLKEISQEIKILNKSELTLDEMEMADSNYIKENNLKKRFDKTWNKLCKILGRPPNTGRVVEKSIRPSGTGYSIIDKAIERFMKDRHRKFPDYFDIRDVVMKTNEKHDLRMSPQVLKGIIADVFTDIGNKLQRLREKDLVFNFGSHLLDDFKTDEDPALSNEDLSRKLERNRKISKRKLKQVYAKFTHLERYGKTGKKGTTSTDPDENDSINSDDTTTDDEQETYKTMKGITSMSDEEDLINPASPCSPRNENCTTTSNKTEDVLDNVTPRTVRFVSLIIDGDTIDDLQPSKSTSMSNGTSMKQTENCVETSPQDPNEDCCIIDDEPEEKSCIGSINQTLTTSLTSDKHGASNVVDQQNSNQMGINATNSKKRKAPTESRVEELVSALKRKKLKAPDSWTEVSSPIAASEEHKVKTLLRVPCVNGSSSPVPMTEESHINLQQRHSDSEFTTGNHKLDLAKSKPVMSLSFQQSTGEKNGVLRFSTNDGQTNATVNHSIASSEPTPIVSLSAPCITTEEENIIKPDVIIIDD